MICAIQPSCRFTVRKVTKEIEISIALSHLIERLDIYRFTAKLLPALLTDDTAENHLVISYGFLRMLSVTKCTLQAS